MLQLINVTKIYKTKAGETRALDGVSLTLPESGMVFVLGKSGSGKSTLLNVCGGLDYPDEGEVIIKGKSTKDFTVTDYDSYRNTCVGFVFQEYNILNAFSVEDNIALALELQGRHKDRRIITDILEQVDLQDCASRKPSTLSGGQKQRVAIARALVKNPEIIMADEPSGALDSATGKQVFDTLKKLSADKLILVVSHDREFAEKYADRIIELKDGKIISDVVKTCIETQPQTDKLTFIDNDTVLVRKGAELEKDDLKKLSDFFSAADCDVIVSKNPDEITKFKNTANVSQERAKTVFKENTSATKTRQYTPDECSFIKSRMPLRRAIKIGASGMKIKPVRFVFTILLAVIAFSMFGMFSTVMFYDAQDVAINSLRDSGEQYINASGQMVIDISTYENGKLKEQFNVTEKATYTDEDISALRNKYGDGVIPVYNVNRMSFDNYSINDYSFFYISSFVPYDEVQVAYAFGRAPQTDDEIAISEYAYNLLTSYKYNYVSKPEDISLKTESGEALKVCGIYKTGYSADGLHIADNLPASYSSLGDNFYMSALVTDGFYQKHRRTNEYNSYSLYSYCYGSFSASTDENGYSAPSSTFVDSLGKSNVVSSFCAVNTQGVSSSDTSDGIAVNYNLWHELYAPDLNSAAEKKGVADIFNSVKDENGLTLADKYNALNRKSFENDITSFSQSAESMLCDLLAFVNEYDLVEDYGITFYDNAKNKIATSTVKVVVYPSNHTDEAAVFANDEIYTALKETTIESSAFFQEYVTEFDFVAGDYSGVLIPVADNFSLLSELVRGELIKSDDYTTYRIENANYRSVTSVSNTVASLSQVFLWVGVGTAIFAALLLFNFISISIADKKREIGILRALGAKSSDVFSIFLAEAMIIVLICASISVIITAIVCAVLNNQLSAVLSTTFSLFSFGILSVAMIFGTAIITAIISTVIPVWIFSRKKPVDTIRDL